MIPTIGVMLSVYFVFKAFEVISFGVKNRDDVPTLIVTLLTAAGLVLSGVFFLLIWLNSGT